MAAFLPALPHATKWELEARLHLKVRRAGLPNLILAVSERLKVGEGDLEGLPGPVVFFKGKLDPGRVREVAESLGTG